jgi:hypothetical protein
VQVALLLRRQRVWSNNDDWALTTAKRRLKLSQQLCDARISPHKIHDHRPYRHAACHGRSSIAVR